MGWSGAVALRKARKAANAEAIAASAVTTLDRASMLLYLSSCCLYGSGSRLIAVVLDGFVYPDCDRYLQKTIARMKHLLTLRLRLEPSLF